MVDDSHKLSITYSSGLIPPPELMSTLAVFYDEIWLPYPYNLDPDGILMSPLLTIFNEGEQNHYLELKNNWKPLFDIDLLRTISPFSLSDLNTSNSEFRSAAKSIGNFDFKEDSNISSESVIDAVAALVLVYNLLNPNKSRPELFISNFSNSQTIRLANLLILYLFQVKIPQMQSLNAEQILEVRDYLKDTKEGFAYYINEMTDDVERRIREHNLSDLEATQKTFERKIQPQYEEFRRKLAAKKTGFWSRVAVAGGKFMQVDATPLSIRFLGAVLEMFGVSLDAFSKSEQENFLSNQSQAFNYIATLESEVSKRNP